MGVDMKKVLFSIITIVIGVLFSGCVPKMEYYYSEHSCLCEKLYLDYLDALKTNNQDIFKQAYENYEINCLEE
jgi:hypothetical protein